MASNEIFALQPLSFSFTSSTELDVINLVDDTDDKVGVIENFHLPMVSRILS